MSPEIINGSDYDDGNKVRAHPKRAFFSSACRATMDKAIEMEQDCNYGGNVGIIVLIAHMRLLI